MGRSLTRSSLKVYVSEAESRGPPYETGVSIPKLGLVSACRPLLGSSPSVAACRLETSARYQRHVPANFVVRVC